MDIDSLIKYENLMLKVKFDLKEVEFNLQFNLACTEYEIYNYPEFRYCVYIDIPLHKIVLFLLWQKLYNFKC